jgi:hypothetical protein
MKHPHPWKIAPERGDHLGGIVDANGFAVCSFGDASPYDNACGEAPAEPFYTLMTLAPEMEDLLRNKHRQIHGLHCDGFGHQDCRQEWIRRRDELLNRIDVANKGIVPNETMAALLSVADNLTCLRNAPNCDLGQAGSKGSSTP